MYIASTCLEDKKPFLHETTPKSIKRTQKKEVFCKRPQKRRVVETPGIYINIHTYHTNIISVSYQYHTNINIILIPDIRVSFRILHALSYAQPFISKRRFPRSPCPRTWWKFPCRWCTRRSLRWQREAGATGGARNAG